MRHWSAPLAVVAVLAGTTALYWPSFQSLLHEWFEAPSSAYSHGPLVVLAALYLALRAVRGSDVDLATAGYVFWSAVLAVASLAWLVALRSGIQVGHQALLPILLWLAVRVLLGARIARHCLVPVGLLYSAIPLWHLIIPALQEMTVNVVSMMLRIAAIPAYVEGDFVYIRAGAFHVEDGCAGLHYFSVSVTMAVIFAELRRDCWRTLAWLVGLAIGFALVANWVRVFVIIVLGYLSDMQNYLVRVEHGTFGWVVFAVAMFLFMLVARRLRTPQREPGSRGAGALRGSAPGAALAVLALAVGPAWSAIIPAGAARAVNVSPPAAVAGWSGPRDGCAGDWQPQFAGADREAMREYQSNDGVVCLYVATFLSQHQDKELVGYSSRVYGSDSEVSGTGQRVVAGHEVNEVRITRHSGSERLVWFSYAVGAREMRSGIEAQLRYGIGSLHDSPPASVVAISATCGADCADARGLLAGFLPNLTIGVGHD